MQPDRLFSDYVTPLYPIPTYLSPKGALDTKIECILFDIYGTLFISGSGDIGTVMRSAKNSKDLKRLFRKYKIALPVEILLDQFFHTIETEHRALKKRGVDYPEVRIENIWLSMVRFKSREEAKAFAIEFELIVNPIYPMPGLEKVLIALRGKNIPLGIISNAQFYTPMMVEWFLKTDFQQLGFLKELLIFSYQFSRAKPSKFLFQTAAERMAKLGIMPDRVLYVGNDMLNDISPAASTGFHTALFAGDKRSLRLRQDDRRCAHTQPDIIITDLMQLTENIRT